MNFDYKIKYSNRKTLNITVERDRTIIVRAPKSLTSERISEIVESKRHWIREKLEHSQKYPLDYSPKEFVSGETLMYLGKNYQLLVKQEDFDGIKFNQRFAISKSNQGDANKLFKNWYMERSLLKIQPLARKFAESLGVVYNECKVSEMKYRWASCTPKNNIIFNWRIIKSPMYVIEYLVAHELVHLLEPNHSPQFWHILSIQIPDYEKAKDWLKVNGHLLEVDF